jgi:hypothetical protein
MCIGTLRKCGYTQSQSWRILMGGSMTLSTLVFVYANDNPLAEVPGLKTCSLMGLGGLGTGPLDTVYHLKQPSQKRG